MFHILPVVQEYVSVCIQRVLLKITPIKSIGEQFDPNLHNAVFAEEVEGKEAGEILEEFSMGFNSPYGVVRFATVKIAK